jgi:hypothetical protein
MTGVQFAAGLDFKLGDIQDMIDGAVSKLTPQADPRPFYLTRAATAWGDGSNENLILNFFAPPSGSIWQIRFVTTFGNDAFTNINDGGNPAVPLVGALFAGDPESSPSLAQLLLTGFQFPATTYVPDTTTWCHSNQSLFIVTGLMAPANGQQVGAVVGIEEWRERDVSRNSGA